MALNGRLDYFGSAVNIAARLEGLSMGTDVVISSAVCDDPEVAAWTGSEAEGLAVEPIEAVLKGLDDERFALWRVAPCGAGSLSPRLRRRAGHSGHLPHPLYPMCPTVAPAPPRA